jgi:class 3 adenylate cyclase
MDVAAWLQTLALEQYQAAFREQAITENVLPELTDEDLKELGVLSIGHRRTLLKAIRSLSKTPGLSTAEALSTSRESDTWSGISAPDEAEKRQLTVMFCDLVGSTVLSTQLELEELRDVMVGYQHCCAQVVEALGGFIAKYMGDGVLAYFGYPHAHEDDAERAVRAGLNLIEAVARLSADGTVLHVRIGIATGMVVVGDLVGRAKLKSAVSLAKHQILLHGCKRSQALTV